MTESIDICVCTYRRPSLDALLDGLARQVVGTDVALQVIIADNDSTPSAKPVFTRWASKMPWPIHYIHAPAGNISVARNACLAWATADWVAFVDDDETVPSDWIASLLQTAKSQQADAVFAPSRALYPDHAPHWMRRLEPHSNWPKNRQSIAAHCANALLRYHGTPWQYLRFRRDLGQSGGEDTCYFAEIERLGARLIATDTPQVTEPVVPTRLSLKWLMFRRYREGQTHFDIFLAQSGPGPVLNAFGKAAICLGLFVLCLPARHLSIDWLLRGIRQLGVVSARLNRSRTILYGPKAMPPSGGQSLDHRT